MVRPIVQVSLEDFETRKHDIAAELWRAAVDVGFFYLSNTGITDVGTSFTHSKTLFALTDWRLDSA